MPTFRVYLGPQGAQPGVYAFSTTLVRPTRDAALQDAFDAWKAEPGSTAPATLADCAQSVKQV